MAMDFGLQDGIDLINLQIAKEFMNVSRIDNVAGVHALTLIFLKYMLDEVK
jgi:hypothetical protein